MKIKTPRPIIQVPNLRILLQDPTQSYVLISKFAASSSFNIDLSKQFANIRTIDSKYKV